MSPEQFLAHARTYRFSRQIITIRNWFYDEGQIGPSERTDLTLIAAVTKSAELDKAANDVFDAISFLRSNHVRAGSLLREAVRPNWRKCCQQLRKTARASKSRISVRLGSWRWTQLRRTLEMSPAAAVINYCGMTIRNCYYSEQHETPNLAEHRKKTLDACLAKARRVGLLGTR